MEEVIRIGMAEFAVSRAPQKITTLGLGSCVGASIFDPLVKVGGMIHIMLPYSSMALKSENPAKFADTGLPLLVERLEQLGASRSHMFMKIVGGAEMFKIDGHDDRLRIGARNIEAVENICQEMSLPIVARSVGGNTGKSIVLNLEDGSVQIRMISGIIVI
jgi:chemotaxis protein CheD